MLISKEFMEIFLSNKMNRKIKTNGYHITAYYVTRIIRLLTAPKFIFVNLHYDRIVIDNVCTSILGSKICY